MRSRDRLVTKRYSNGYAGLQRARLLRVLAYESTSLRIVEPMPVVAESSFVIMLLPLKPNRVPGVVSGTRLSG